MIYRGKVVRKFFSNASNGDYVGSNFWTSPLRFTREREDGTVRTVEYPTAEHAFQATKVKGRAGKALFQTGGKYGEWDGMKYLYGAAERASKTAFWQKKDMMGIIAKMAISAAIRGEAMGFELLPVNNFASVDEAAEIWMPLLRAKREGSPAFARWLDTTGTAYLLEFARGAAPKRSGEVRPNKWAGYIDDKGVLWGDNYMGQLLMRLRDE